MLFFYILSFFLFLCCLSFLDIFSSSFLPLCQFWDYSFICFRLTLIFTLSFFVILIRIFIYHLHYSVLFLILYSIMPTAIDFYFLIPDSFSICVSYLFSYMSPSFCTRHHSSFLSSLLFLSYPYLCFCYIKKKNQQFLKEFQKKY